mgnify:CR=1 FL=1
MGSERQVRRLAETLVRHSVKAKKGEIVRISTGELGRPLALEIYRELLRAGAHPLLSVGFEEANAIFYEEASAEQIAHMPPTKMREAKTIDADIVILAPGNTRHLSHIPPRKMADRRKATKPISEVVLRRVRWVLTNFPTEALAQETDRSLPEYEKLYYRAVEQDWPAMSRMFTRAKKVLEKADRVRITGKETDLSFSIKGRTAIPCAGEFNMPDGEIFTGPIEDSAEGVVQYDFPVCNAGREIASPAEARRVQTARRTCSRASTSATSWAATSSSRKQGRTCSGCVLSTGKRHRRSRSARPSSSSTASGVAWAAT